MKTLQESLFTSCSEWKCRILTLTSARQTVQRHLLVVLLVKVQFKYCLILELWFFYVSTFGPLMSLMYISFLAFLSASPWRMWKPCCLRSTTESPTCASSKTSYRSDQSDAWQESLFVNVFASPPAAGCSDSTAALFCVTLMHILHVHTGGGGQERSIVPQLRTALQDTDVWRPEECKCQFWVCTQTQSHSHEEVLKSFTDITERLLRYK